MLKLTDLLQVQPHYKLQGDADCSVNKLRFDSRRVGRDDVFFAWKGTTTDAHHFIADVCE